MDALFGCPEKGLLVAVLEILYMVTSYFGEQASVDEYVACYTDQTEYQVR